MFGNILPSRFLPKPIIDGLAPRAGLNRCPGFGDPVGVNASVEARTRRASLK